ncbi:hypothetical protein, partial [Archangium sp.]|uniref:hypothetical protein n=1 Tax=Archangium sp. TaxID=1872627 RepID=UPI002D586369
LIDVGFVERELISRGVQIDQLHETELGGMWNIKTDENSEAKCVLSPRRLERVLYGLLSLRSAIELVAAIARATTHSDFHLKYLK